MARDGGGRRLLTRRVLALGAVAAVVIAGGAVWVLRSGAAPSYRTARAGYASVDQTLTSVGTIGSANQVSVAFPVAGSVASVAVTVGQEVSAGQTLATLDPTSLQQQLDSATQTLSSAQQKLATDSAAQQGVSIDSAAEQSLTADSASPTARPETGANSGYTMGEGVDSLQQAVLSAQRDLDAVLSDLQLGSCAAASVSFSVSGLTASGGTVTAALAVPPGSTAVLIDATGATVSAAGGALAPDAGSTFTFSGVDAAAEPGPYSIKVTLPGSGVLDAACLGDALTSLQAEVAAKEKVLDAAVTALTRALSPAGQQTGSTGSTGATGSTGSRANGSGTGQTSGQGATQSGGQSNRQGSAQDGGQSSRQGSGQGSTAGSSGSGRAAPVTAADLAADQAHIDADQAGLAMAQQNLAAATLTSPIAGRVAAVALSGGQQVPALSQSATVTVLGPGATIVSTTVPLARIDSVAVGQPAQVRVDSASTALRGTVSRIGLLATTTGSATSYPVTVTLAATDAKLYDGTAATVTVTTGTASHALTVPASAVHTVGNLHTVDQLAGGKLRTVRVGVGVTGSELAQITSGLRAGEAVVLARLDAPLPSDGAGSARRFGGGGTGLGGAGPAGGTRRGG